uniref:Uncharacterized protein n=1 Tax=Cannabis sativa TaxID=3483 RepID=A0A803PHN2_CANSA
MPLEDEENGLSGAVIGFEVMSEDDGPPRIDSNYSRRVSMSLDQNVNGVGKISFLASMASYSKRKKPPTRTDQPPNLKVVQAIHAAFSAFPKKSTKKDKAIVTKNSSPVRDSHKEKEKVIEIEDEPSTSSMVISPIEIDVAESSSYNEHKRVVKLAENLPSVKQRAFDAEIKIHHLKGQVAALEAKAAANIALYEGYCFDAIYNSWSVNGGADDFNWAAFGEDKITFFSSQCDRCANEVVLCDINFNLNGDVQDVRHAAGVEGYHPKHPNLVAVKMYQKRMQHKSRRYCKTR